MKIEISVSDPIYDLLLNQADGAGLTIEEYVLYLIKQGLRIVNNG